MEPLTGIFATEVGGLTALARLVVAALLGMAVGLDRELRNHAAGLRTHMLVSVAAATFTVLALELIARTDSEDSVQADPTRVLEAVTAGVAFLAAGAIIQARGQVRGITTGAGLWLAGAVGTAAGIGAFVIAVMATVIGVIILSALTKLEEHLPNRKDGDGEGNGA